MASSMMVGWAPSIVSLDSYADKLPTIPQFIFGRGRSLIKTTTRSPYYHV